MSGPLRAQRPTALFWWTLAGSVLFAAAAHHAGYPRPAVGFLAGAGVALLNHRLLAASAGRLLAAEGAARPGVFLLVSALRLLVLGGAYFLFLRVSVGCLLAAAGSHGWFLAGLAFLGGRTAGKGAADSRGGTPRMRWKSESRRAPLGPSRVSCRGGSRLGTGECRGTLGKESHRFKPRNTHRGT